MANCVLPMCGVQRIPKYAGIGIFKVTTRKGEFYEDWRQKLINVILKYRVMSEKDLRTRIFGTGIYICERHFLPKEIECTSKYYSTYERSELDIEICPCFFKFAIE